VNLRRRLQYWIANCATPIWFDEEKTLERRIGRQLLLHGEIGRADGGVRGGHARELRQGRIDLRERAHADVGYDRARGKRRRRRRRLDHHVGLAAQLIEGQEKLIGDGPLCKPMTVPIFDSTSPWPCSPPRLPSHSSV